MRKENKEERYKINRKKQLKKTINLGSYGNRDTQNIYSVSSPYFTQSHSYTYSHAHYINLVNL